jgi:hypothetical protein
MKKIFLRGKYGSIIGNYALVDNVDFYRLNKFKWCSSARFGKLKNINFYAISNPKTYLYLHRMVLMAKKNQIIDHINGNGLDNRRSNLRFCTKSQNNVNKKSFNNTSGFYGVYWDKKNKKFRSVIGCKGKRYHLGRFITAKEASIAYEKKSIKLFGKFAPKHLFNSNK